MYSHFQFPEKKKHDLLVYVLGTLRTLEGSGRTNTEVRLALPSAKPSLPRGLLRGKPPNVPKNRQRFFEKNFVSKFLVYLERADARRKQLENRIGRAAGPPTPPGYGIPTHLPTSRSLVNAIILAEAYLRHIREHRNKVEKQRLERTEPRWSTPSIYYNKLLNPEVQL